MLLLYSELPKSVIYQGIDTYQVTNRDGVRHILKEYYGANSGKDKMVIGIHDQVIDDMGGTLVDLIARYVVLPFVELYIVYPQRDYSDIAIGNNLNLVFKISNRIQDYVKHYAPTGIKLHSIDDVSYFFYGIDK